ncbi:MAG: pseudaminic acid synthase [Bacteroidaceae bacterium]|jgi:pseudaminic acid synthase|nr:pseudaminic acid synthase [Bacteroidaceae bacterium]
MKFDNKLFIIAELSANHNHDLSLAIKTIEAIAQSGANAVKVQTYTADSLTLDIDNEYFGPRKDGLWKGRTLYDLYTEGALPYEWYSTLQKVAEDNGLVFFSSPFAKKDVDFLETINCPIYKVASPEITDIPLITYIASQGKPMIISTGMADENDIRLAIETCYKEGNRNITLLKCTSEYPASPDMANLLTIPDIKNQFNVRVGLSDHTMGSTVPIAAVALGATVIEKHFILNRNLGGIDSSFSMEPAEFAEMVKACHDAYAALGNVSYQLTERNRLRRRSLFAAEDIKAGEIITEYNIRSVRPGHGLHPKFLKEILGKKVIQNLEKGEPFSLDYIKE